MNRSFLELPFFALVFETVGRLHCTLVTTHHRTLHVIVQLGTGVLTDQPDLVLDRPGQLQEDVLCVANFVKRKRSQGVGVFVPTSSTHLKHLGLADTSELVEVLGEVLKEVGLRPGSNFTAGGIRDVEGKDMLLGIRDNEGYWIFVIVQLLGNKAEPAIAFLPERFIELNIDFVGNTPAHLLDCLRVSIGQDRKELNLVGLEDAEGQTGKNLLGLVDLLVGYYLYLLS